MVEAPAIAFAGSGGSHPGTIRLIAEAARTLQPERRRVVFDLSAFDSRSTASYAGVPAEVVSVTPASMKMRSAFRTAAPNLVLSGGTRRFDFMVDRFARMLVERRIGGMLLCHLHGFPEQAMMQACRATGVPLAQIDEGPFSGMITGPLGKARQGRGERLLVAAGMLPRRDRSGASHTLLFPTAPGRARALVTRGIGPERIVTIASPRFDGLPETAARWRARPKAADGAARVLILHQPFARDRKVDRGAASAAERILIDGLVAVAAERPLTITLRAHPRSDPDELARLEALLAPIAAPSRVSTTQALYDQLLEQDAAVGFYSSALLEAAACGMPTACVVLPHAAFARGGEGVKAGAMPGLGVPGATDVAQFAALVRSGLDAGIVEPAPALFDEALGVLTGHAARDLAERLMAMADDAAD